MACSFIAKDVMLYGAGVLNLMEYSDVIKCIVNCKGLSELYLKESKVKGTHAKEFLSTAAMQFQTFASQGVGMLVRIIVGDDRMLKRSEPPPFTWTEVHLLSHLRYNPVPTVHWSPYT